MTAQPHEVLDWVADEFPPARRRPRSGVGRFSYVLTLAAFAMLVLVTPALIAAALLSSAWLLALAGVLMVCGAVILVVAGRKAETRTRTPRRRPGRTAR